VDTPLLARLAVDVDGAFEELVRSQQHFVYGVARRLTLDPHDAQDVAQEAFVRAYRALCGYERERVHALRLRPWLARITLNVQRNRVRRHRPTAALDSDITSQLTAASDDGPEARVLALSHRDECAALVDGLPEPYRMAIALRHIDGLSYAEVAEVLDRPVGTVKAQVHRGLALLRDAINGAEGEEWKEGA
jgi:RNA polymerase sigma-70 factor, ECF subfamily